MKSYLRRAFAIAAVGLGILAAAAFGAVVIGAAGAAP